MEGKRGRIVAFWGILSYMDTTTRSPLADDAALEQPTIFILGKIVTPADKALLEGVQRAGKSKVVTVKQLEVTPALRAALKLSETDAVAVVLDRRGREVGRSSDLKKVIEFGKNALQIGRIDWAMEGTPTGDLAKRLTGAPSVNLLPSIMRAMSYNPEAMMGMIEMANMMHFRPGALPVKTKELIATFVSSLNQCHYCLSSHASFLEKQGQKRSDVDAVALGDPAKAAGLVPKERELLAYVKRLTQEPWKVRDFDVEALRKVGWTDAQIYEATFDIALFNFFNRMANAYGLPDAPDGWRPPAAAK